MKIIILGSGQVGAALAESLAQDDHDITVVDSDVEKLSRLQSRIDIRTVVGHAGYPGVLIDAGIEDADALVAVTSSDEVNMIACQAAFSLYQTPLKIARVRAVAYTAYEELFGAQSIPIDVIISPEQLVMQQIRRLIEHPDSLQVMSFAKGRVQMVGVKAFYGGPLIGHPLKDLKKHMPNVATKVVAIYRQGQTILPTQDTAIEPDDEVFFLSAPADINAVMSEMRSVDAAYRRIIIAGGGNIGGLLAEVLEQRYHVKVIEHQKERANLLAEMLSEATVLHADAADRALLFDEDIQETDIFCAVTNSDENNILSSLLAKQMGARKVITLINRSAYVDVIQRGEIDVAVSPQLITLSGILPHIRGQEMVNVYPVRRGAAEAIEAVVSGGSQPSNVLGKRVRDLRLPLGSLIGGIVRGDQVFLDCDDLELAVDDHVVIFVVDRRQIPKIQSLFQLKS